MQDPFRQTRDPKVRAERYQRLAWEYYGLAKETSSPFLRPALQRTVEDYQLRARTELRLMEREGGSTAAGGGT